MRLFATPSKIEVSEAKKHGRLLVLWLEIWPSCHLNCQFCFNNGGRASKEESWLKVEDYYRMIDEFASLGGKYIGIPGYGEPFHPQNVELTISIIRYAKERQVKTYVFTTADLIGLDLAKQLDELKVTLMVKFNSFKASIQDTLVGVSGYAAKRAKALEILKQLDFTKNEKGDDGEVTTRLGFVTSIIPENENEIEEIWKYCLANNIYPDVDTILPSGRGECFQATSPEKIREICKSATGKDLKSPTYLDGHCDRTQYGLYVNYQGKIFPCLGCKSNGKKISLGNVGAGLALAWNMVLMRKIRNRDYFGKCATCQHFQNNECNSCFGRCCTKCSEDEIKMEGCPFYSGPMET
ncbi:MAG: 4Fe-4S cluster-binding domain-containing protein [Candidatus Parcubacteria bacterium]|nr:4Fe-4S cluster-binding domain-containing protein [Candidatus Parcubacteria bacterium]